MTHQGDVVAVKVQYPDIARALKVDLDNLGAMVGVFASTTRMVHGKAYYAELRESMMDELDYRQEAARARMFALAAAPLHEVQGAALLRGAHLARRCSPSSCSPGRRSRSS